MKTTNGGPVHGTRTAYTHHGCRCTECRAANNAYVKSRGGKEPPRHGTIAGYRVYRCRCDLCRKAGSIGNRKTKKRHKLRLAALKRLIRAAKVAVLVMESSGGSSAQIDEAASMLRAETERSMRDLGPYRPLRREKNGRSA